MKERNGQTSSTPRRAIAEREIKRASTEPGVVTARVGKRGPRRRAGVTPPPTHSIVTRSSAYIEPQEREALIAESAYFRSAHRGFEPGHEIDDWLAAESEIDAALARGDLSSLCG